MSGFIDVGEPGGKYEGRQKRKGSRILGCIGP